MCLLVYRMAGLRWRWHGLAVTMVLVMGWCVGHANTCRISEFTCRNGRCVRLNGYCDGVDDCGDLSDEPSYCTGNYHLNFQRESERKVISCECN